MTATEATPPPQRATRQALLDITLPADAASVPAARHAIRLALQDTPHHADRVDTILLLATELLSNAVREGDGSIHLHVSDGAGPVRVEVSDGAPTSPAVQHLGTGATTGRGLMLVDALAAQWGHDHTPAGKTVWFVVGG